MEKWIEIIIKRISTDQMDLPPGDWDSLEKEYFSRKRRRWTLPLTILTASAAAAVVMMSIIPNHSADTENYYETKAPYVANGSSSMETIEETKEPLKKVSRPAYGIITPSATPSMEFIEPSLENNEVTEEKEEYPSQKHINEESKYSIDRYYFDNTVETIQRKSRKKVELSSHIGGFKSNRANGNGENSHIGYAVSGEMVEIPAHHSVPYSIGLDISYPIDNKLSLVSGIEASVYRSEFYNAFGIGKNRQYNQTAWFIGIPLTMEYTIWQADHFSFWIGAGGKVDRCIYAYRNGTKVRDNNFNWSVLANTGIQYSINNKVGLFLSPEVSWYFKPEHTDLYVYRTEKPLMFTIDAGMKFNLSHRR